MGNYNKGYIYARLSPKLAKCLPTVFDCYGERTARCHSMCNFKGAGVMAWAGVMACGGEIDEDEGDDDDDG